MLQTVLRWDGPETSSDLILCVVLPWAAAAPRCAWLLYRWVHLVAVQVSVPGSCAGECTCTAPAPAEQSLESMDMDSRSVLAELAKQVKKELSSKPGLGNPPPEVVPWTTLLSHEQPHRQRINGNFSHKEAGPRDNAGAAVGILGKTSSFLLTSKTALRKRDSKVTQLLLQAISWSCLLAVCHPGSGKVNPGYAHSWEWIPPDNVTL